MPQATKVMSKPPRALRKIRPELTSMTTLELLEKVGAEAARLRSENKRLTSELAAAKKRVTALEKRAKPTRKAAAAVPEAEVAPVEKKPSVKRQALGTGLARFLTARSK